MTRILLALALTACCGAAMAQTVTVSKDNGETETVQTAEVAKEDAPTEASRRTCLRSTGSRIVAAENLRAEKSGKPQRCTNAFGRVYTSEDLDRTGHANLADALRTLDPRVH